MARMLVRPSAMISATTGASWRTNAWASAPFRRVEIVAVPVAEIHPLIQLPARG